MKELRKYLSIISHFPCWKRCKTHTLVLERLMMISQKSELDFTHFLKNKSHPGINLKLKKKWVYTLQGHFCNFPSLTKLSPSNRQRKRQRTATVFLARQPPPSSSPATSPAAATEMPVRVVDTATPSSQPSPGHPTALSPSHLFRHICYARIRSAL